MLKIHKHSITLQHVLTLAVTCLLVVCSMSLYAHQAATRKTNVGLLGGTFNPIHNGHLRVAVEVLEQLQLDQLWLMPNYQSPLKRDIKTPFSTRLKMVKLASAGLKNIKASDYESKFDGPSFTYMTTSSLAKTQPDKIFYFITGIDAFSNFTTKWQQHQKILQSVNLILINRPGYTIEPSSAEGRLLAERQVKVATLNRNKTGQILVITAPGLEISSTEIRDKLQHGLIVRGLLPCGVEKFIQRHKLYQDHSK